MVGRLFGDGCDQLSFARAGQRRIVHEIDFEQLAQIVSIDEAPLAGGRQVRPVCEDYADYMIGKMRGPAHDSRRSVARG